MTRSDGRHDRGLGVATGPVDRSDERELEVSLQAVLVEQNDAPSATAEPCHYAIVINGDLLDAVHTDQTQVICGAYPHVTHGRTVPMPTDPPSDERSFSAGRS